MKVLLICGSFPPLKCGVGDYVYHLSKALVEDGAQVTVLTSTADEVEAGPNGVDVNRRLPDWKIKRLLAALKFVRRVHPDIVHLQYPAKEYNGALAVMLPLALRLLGFRVVQTWHEHYSECRAIAWPNLLGCHGLIHVRPDLPGKLPGWVRKFLAETPIRFIPNASTIPRVTQPVELVAQRRQEISNGRSIIAFFGFANPNKGIERLFEIADPATQHLLLICDLDVANEYQASIFRLAELPAWKGKVTFTGFQSAEKVGELLAISDAVVFPFPSGAGEWNSSLQAAETAGVFALATSEDPRLHGYHPDRNVYFTACSDQEGMRKALETHQGQRNNRPADQPWRSIASAHLEMYQFILAGKAIP